MGKFNNFALGVAAASMLALPVPTFAAPNGPDENMRKLDIMLMVTSLRCRFGADNFQPEYQRFSASHLTSLNASARRMESGMVARYGAKGAKRELDKVSVTMANHYGQGHPWLGCGELKSITRELAGTKDPVALAQAADELLGAAPRTGGRFARR